MLCGCSENHVPTITKKGTSIINYFACEAFASSTCTERFEMLKKKKLCFQCLSPGYKAGHNGRCFDKYKCPDPSHSQKKRGLHVLICNMHKENPQNVALLQQYKDKCIIGANVSHADFSKNIAIFHVEAKLFKVGPHSEAEETRAVYMLQTILVGNERLRIFFDTGCYDMVVKKKAVDHLAKL